MDYDIMSDQEWEPEAEDGEDIMVTYMPLPILITGPLATARRMLPTSCATLSISADDSTQGWDISDTAVSIARRLPPHHISMLPGHAMSAPL